MPPGSKPSMGDDVVVRLLGPVRLEVDGRPVRLGAQLRVVLAVLAMARGRPVSRARLAELLWGQPTPDAADATLRSHVAHLRRATEPRRPARQAPRLVITTEHGYALRLAPGWLDSARFEELLAGGRDALSSGDARRAAELLGEALALWYGEPLADVAEEPFAVAEAARLRTLRGTAVRLRIDADLALGRHEEVLGELRSLVAADPADEGLRGRLALALYRSGQTEAAIEVCAEGLRLAHERGLDAPALRAMQTDVLRRAPMLDWPRPPRPFQLPADIAEFTGRVTELAELAEALTVPPAAVAVDGKPGIGKSALAVHLAHRLAPRFPDGVLYVNLRGAEPQQLAPADVLGRFLRALGVPDQQVPASLDAAAATFRSVLASRQVLIVLDNAADAAQVRPLLPAGPGTAVLITSRRPMADLDGVTPRSLDLLGVDDAVTLLGRLAGARRVAAEPDAAHDVVRYCGLLPLAVRIAAARLRARQSWPVATLAHRLADEQRRLAELAVGDLAVQSSFRLSYQALEPPDARLFRLLGLLDGPDAGVEVAAAMVDEPAGEVEPALERLVDAQLLETHAAGRYRFHDLLRLFARQCAATEDGPAAVKRALARAFDWYVRGVERANGALGVRTRARSRAEEDAALAWLDLERANLVSAVLQAAAAAPEPLCAAAWRLDDGLSRYFSIRRPFPEWIATGEAALAAATATGESRPQGVAHRHLGAIFSAQGRFEESERHLQRALAVFEECGDRREESLTLDKLGTLYGMRGQLAEAVGYCAAAADVAREIGDPMLESRALNNLGYAHCELDRLDEAAGFVRRAVAILRDLGDRFEMSITLESLGQIQFKQRRFTEALSTFEESLSLARGFDDRFDEAMALRGIGLVTRELYGAAAARPSLKQALTILCELDAPEAAEVERLLDLPR